MEGRLGGLVLLACAVQSLFFGGEGEGGGAAGCNVPLYNTPTYVCCVAGRAEDGGRVWAWVQGGMQGCEHGMFGAMLVCMGAGIYGLGEGSVMQRSYLRCWLRNWAGW